MTGEILSKFALPQFWQFVRIPQTGPLLFQRGWARDRGHLVMADTTIGDFRFRSDGRTLTIIPRDAPDKSISLDRNCFEELLDFVNTIVKSDYTYNRRQAFRVPLWESCGLKCEIRVDESLFLVRPTDISLTGIFVEFRPEDPVTLRVSDLVDVQMTMDGNTSTFRSIVKRVEGHGAGLFFARSRQAEQISPPSEITRLVMDLQRRWIARNYHRIP